MLGIPHNGAAAVRTLRYCPIHARQDRLGPDGQTWWRRQHQIPAVVVCPEHLVRLKSIERRAGQSPVEYALTTAERVIPQIDAINAVDPHSASDRVFLALAEDIGWLLGRTADGIERARLAATYGSAPAGI